MCGDVTPEMLRAGGAQVLRELKRDDIEVGYYTAQIIARAAFRAMVAEAAEEHISQRRSSDQ